MLVLFCDADFRYVTSEKLSDIEPGAFDETFMIL